MWPDNISVPSCKKLEVLDSWLVFALSKRHKQFVRRFDTLEKLFRPHDGRDVIRCAGKAKNWRSDIDGWR